MFELCIYVARYLGKYADFYIVYRYIKYIFELRINHCKHNRLDIKMIRLTGDFIYICLIVRRQDPYSRLLAVPGLEKCPDYQHLVINTDALFIRLNVLCQRYADTDYNISISTMYQRYADTDYNIYIYTMYIHT